MVSASPRTSPLNMDCVFLFLLLSASSALLGESFQRGQGVFSTHRSCTTQPTSPVILESFSYLGDLGVEGYGSGSTTSSTSGSTMEPQQAFPLQPSLQWQEDATPTQFYYQGNDVSLPAPPLITNPYDGATSWIPEEVAPARVVTPAIVPRSSTSAITTVNPRTTTSTYTNTNYQKNVRSIWETSAATVVQGSSLRTWNFVSEKLEAVQVLLKTNGRPLHANIELWQGEDHTPQKISVYTEDGEARPFSAFLATPFKGPTAIAVKNSGNAEFPLKACVEGDLYNVKNKSTMSSMPGYGNRLAQATLRRLYESALPRVVQGDGASYIVPFDESVTRVQILITTEERPLNARIELLQGPNNIKQVIEVSTEDGKARPFFAVVETPGLANAMRIVNTGPLEFPIDCRVEPFSVVDSLEDYYFLDAVDATGQLQQQQQESKSNNWNVWNFLGGRT
jgi:hypothetical protein